MCIRLRGSPAVVRGRRMNNDGRTDVDHFPMMAMASLAEVS